MSKPATGSTRADTSRVLDSIGATLADHGRLRTRLAVDRLLESAAPATNGLDLDNVTWLIWREDLCRPLDELAWPLPCGCPVVEVHEWTLDADGHLLSLWTEPPRTPLVGRLECEVDVPYRSEATARRLIHDRGRSA